MGADSNAPLEGAASKRLARLAGLNEEELWQLADKINLLSFFPGRKARRRDFDPAVHNGKGDVFDQELARQAAGTLACSLDGYRLVVCLGLKVARALKLAKPRLLKNMKGVMKMATLISSCFLTHPVSVTGGIAPADADVQR